jgi:hypothetical protein
LSRFILMACNTAKILVLERSNKKVIYGNTD